MTHDNSITPDITDGPSVPASGLWTWVALAAVVIVACVIRARLLGMPLERDEGEYAYAGQLWLQGVSPLGHVYNMKLPGVYAAYAVILALFGQTSYGIHLGFLVIIALSSVFLFLLARRLFDGLTGVLAAAAYGLLSMSQASLGLAGHAGHLVMVFALAGLLVTLKAAETQRRWLYFFAGMLFSIGATMKQPGALFAAFACAYMLIRWFKSRPHAVRGLLERFAIFALGFMLPLGLICLDAWRSGEFARFWFWTFEYTQQYGSQVALKTGLRNLTFRLTQVIPPSAIIWSLAAVGGAAAVWDKPMRRGALFALWFAFFSAACTFPGLYFRSNYFIFIMPAGALLAGVGATALGRLAARRWSRARSAVTVGVFGAAMVCALVAQSQLLFELSPVMACRQTYGANPFPESPEIAQYIQKHTNANDTIAVIGSEPQIYFYAHRRAATGYVYTYALMEHHPYVREMQNEMIAEIEAARPKYIVCVNIRGSWLTRPDSDMMILDWAGRYVRTYYHKVGLVEITPDRGTLWSWGPNSDPRMPDDNHCVIMERSE